MHVNQKSNYFMNLTKNFKELIGNMISLGVGSSTEK